jgi:serine/threonine-protein kinase
MYRLDEETGRGGMAVVYRAYDTRLERPVAVKVLAPQLAEDEAFRQRFIRESRTAAAVDHPNIIPIFEAGETDGVLYIAMRFVHGRDVQTLIDDDGPLTAAQACHVITQVAAGLEAAHSHGLVHRDVKPGNILLDATGSEYPGHAYLSDFGLSKHALSISALTLTGQFLGTLDYVAPEQIEGRGVDGRTDEYALACTAFTMLTGAPPFTRDESVAVLWAQMSVPPPALSSRRHDLPPAVDDVMAKALAKVPGERYATCPEFAAALRHACGLDPGSAGPPPAQPQAARPSREQPRPVPPGHPATVAAAVPTPAPPAAPPAQFGHLPPSREPAESGHLPPSRDPAESGPPAPSRERAESGPPPRFREPAGSRHPAQPWASGADSDEGPPTEEVLDLAQGTGGSGPAGPYRPAASAYPVPLGGRRRPRLLSLAVILPASVVVLAAGGFLLHNSLSAHQTAATTPAVVLKPPGCTTQVATAGNMPHVPTQLVATGGQPFDVAVSHGFAFVSGSGHGVAVLNASQPVPVPLWKTPVQQQPPQGEALTPDGRHLVLAGGSGITVFSVSSLEQGAAPPIGSLLIPGQQHGVEVAITPDGHFALVTFQDSADVGVFNLQQAFTSGFGPADVVGLIPVSQQPIGIALSPDGRYAYVTTLGLKGHPAAVGAVNVIDVAKAETHPASAVVTSVPAGCRPSRLVASADGQQVWVTAGGSNALLGFSAPKLVSDPGHALLARLAVGQLPLGLMMVDHGARIVVADSNRDKQPGAVSNLAVIDVANALARKPALVGYIGSGMTPRQFALVSGATLLVTNTDSGQLETVDLTHLP